jgi:NADPH:quinone reductase-like Zn-dependent oxidoreductase
MRRGSYPFAPPIPFVPGYETVGSVDALGPGVTGFAIGDRVAALLVHGGYATHVVRGAEHWVKVPAGLDDAEAVALILNYVTAYQMIHRSAKLQPGQRALVNGANGGVGQALLDLLRAHGVHAIGAASAKRHDVVKSYGATAIEGRDVPLEQSVRTLFPEGVDAAFDAIGGAQTGQALRSLKRGGTLVWYGFMGAGSTLPLLRSALNTFVWAPLTGKTGAFYGITLKYRKDPKPLLEDLPKLFALLAEGKIHPRIAQKLPLLDARQANERLEAGNIEGKLVLISG